MHEAGRCAAWAFEDEIHPRIGLRFDKSRIRERLSVHHDSDGAEFVASLCERFDLVEERLGIAAALPQRTTKINSCLHVCLRVIVMTSVTITWQEFPRMCPKPFP